MTLSDTQTSILQQATRHPEGLVVSPEHLPPGPRAPIARALLNGGLVARADQSDVSASWRLDGEVIWLSITNAGREAIGELSEDLAPTANVEPATAGKANTAGDRTTSGQERRLTPSNPQHRPKLRDTATALLACWNATGEGDRLADAVAFSVRGPGPPADFLTDYGLAG